MGSVLMGTPFLGTTMDHSGGDSFNFETLNASVQASIDAKKQENAQMARTIMSLQSAVDALSERCGMLERAVDKERQERTQDVHEMQTLLNRELHKLQLAIDQGKTQQEQRESAAQQRMSEEMTQMIERMDEQRRSLESAMAYVRTSVEQEKIARQASENKLLQALQQVSVSASAAGGGTQDPGAAPGAGSPFTAPSPGWNR